MVTEINDGYYSAFPLCDSDFDETIQKNSFPINISEVVRENLTAFIVKEKFYIEFLDIVNFLIENSPDKRILFQTRYQGGDVELVVGVIKWTEFLRMLSQKKIFFNICYIIEKD